jgi:hypothetical protein
VNDREATELLDAGNETLESLLEAENSSSRNPIESQKLPLGEREEMLELRRVKTGKGGADFRRSPSSRAK